MRPLSRAVERLLRGLGIETHVARAEATRAWAAVAVAAFGADGASTRAVGVEGATLIVAVPTSAWASEIRLRGPELVDRLARAAPASGITRIRTVAAMPR